MSLKKLLPDLAVLVPLNALVKASSARPGSRNTLAGNTRDFSSQK